MHRHATPAHNLALAYPAIAQQWSLRNERPVTDYLPWSNLKVWWICAQGHEWQALISNRAHGNGCPYCHGQYPTAERNLAVLHPTLAAEWSPRNTQPASAFTPGSGISARWVCKQGHEWRATIGSRVAGNGCAACAGKIPTPERNLAALYPALVLEWSPRNVKAPSAFTPFSNRRVWWVCAQKHEWQSTITNRAQGHNGPYCAGQRATPDNNLASLNPILATEWSARNHRLPSEIMLGSNFRAWWCCQKGHEWQAVVSQRSQGRGCPYCSGRFATVENNLAVLNPALATEWSSRNTKPASAYTSRSDAKVWWRCKLGHEWQALIGNRAKGSGCPVCATDYVRSKPEIALTSALAVWLNQPIPAINYAIPGLRWPSGYALIPDFFVDADPIKFAVEYDGSHYHSRPIRIHQDHAKARFLQAAGFLTIRIREAPLPLIDTRYDLVLQPSAVYQDQDEGFPYLARVAREHIDQVCRHTYGGAVWDAFIASTSSRPAPDLVF